MTALALSQPSSLPTPGEEDQDAHARQAPPLVAFILAAFFAVVIFLPPAGRIGAPLHDAMVLLLGRAAFMVPVALVFAGVVLVIRTLRPVAPLPRHRLVGTGLMTLAILPSEDLLDRAQGTGLIGRWLSTWLIELLGGPTTLVLLLVLLGLGAVLAFDVRLLRRARPPGQPDNGPWKDAQN